MLVEALPSDFLTHSETHSSPTWIHHVTDSDSLAIDFSTAEFITPPLITATTYTEDVSVFVSDLTKTTATLNFSAKFTGQVAYIIRERI